MIKVLFICHGNICRSPMAEFVFNDLVHKEHLDGAFCADSAATSTEEIGNGVHYGTREKLCEVDVPMYEHRARQMTKRDYAHYDLLIGLDRANKRNMQRVSGGDPDGKIFNLLEFAGSTRDIADPWYTGNFDETYDDILEGCVALLEKLKSGEALRFIDTR